MDVSNTVSKEWRRSSQRGKKRFWYAIFRDLNGKQLWRRLKVNDRRSAIAAATLLEQTAQRRRSAQHIRKVFGDLYREFYGEGMPPLLLGPTLNSGSNRKGRRPRSPATSPTRRPSRCFWTS